ncbi:hypothetical protein M2282_003249 [Variovorax boronicumulans]|uniref:hypothetical protein n=1 Tax=Variovorax boronicumulans TaxID=436515 RepID=UPI0024751AAC|nr:hypothetical protein [Variovorax boronicumulans]MDH6168098.1 hypothetical protein [Variovorax boronicumulans]
MTRTAHQPKRATRPITAAQVDNHRRYRCTYTPRDSLGHLNPSETGAAPYVQFLAANAEQALDIAQQVTGCPVIDATRIEG